jgi:hypothetical protein
VSARSESLVLLSAARWRLTTVFGVVVEFESDSRPKLPLSVSYVHKR